MNKDTYLIENSGLLMSKKIYLCGAGFDGCYALKLLRMIGINPIAFVDADSRKVGGKIDGLNVFSYKEIALKSVYDTEMLLIISSAAQTGNILGTIEKSGCRCEHVYSLFSLFFCIYFNCNSLFSNAKVYLDKCNLFFDTWKYRWGKLQAMSQGDIAYKAMLKLMMCGDKAPVLIDQPGKVGSHTIKYTLESLGVDYVHFHGFSYNLDIDCPGTKRVFREYLKGLPKIKIITLIREPISKDFGHFFQKISFEKRDFIWFSKGLIQDSLEQSFLNYLSIVTPLDFTKNGMRREFAESTYCHIDYIGQKNCYGANWGFFDDEFKNFWGVDILEYQFDTVKGFGVIKHDNLEILILRLDKLNALEDELRKFLGLDRPLRLVNSNIADYKDYGRAYKELMEKMRLPEEYVDYYYRNNKYTNHFFSGEERELYRKKWLKKE